MGDKPAVQAGPGLLPVLVERSRRLGADPSLVVAGGGNTSAKGTVTDHLGRTHRVLWVKRSGADLATAHEGDFAALRLDELVPLRGFDDLPDDDMARLVGCALLQPGGRAPSIETLLHAFLPAEHVDHVHADAICALTNHKDGAAATREALGDRFAYVDWLRPGHRLSKLVGDLADHDGVVLAHHGLVTWGATSQECYDRTLRAIADAGAYLEAHRAPVEPVAQHTTMPDDERQTLLLHLRGALSAAGRRILSVDPGLRVVADRPDLDVVAAGGASTADHMLWVRTQPCALTGPDVADARERVGRHADDYRAMVDRHRELVPEGRAGHDPMPTVLLVPGLGAVTTGPTRQAAVAVASVARHSLSVAATVADTFGPPERLPDAELVGFDYWELEQNKLVLRPPAPPLAGQVVVVTGAASGIGRGIALALAADGASVVLADVDGDGLEEVRAAAVAAGGPEPSLVLGDQSDPGVTTATVRRAVADFGGLDGVVLNAGIAMTGALDELSLDQWERTLRINLTSAFLLTRASMAALKEQGLGGSLVYVASKNAFSPGAGFGAYSVTKAGMVQLMRIAALEGGAHGIRANAVNPDAVFDHSRLWDDGIREERAAVHGIPPDQLEAFYASRNLTRRNVTTADVAATVTYLLTDASRVTTGAVVPVDGGVAAAFPR